jgi:hypothetical protein
MGGASFTGMNKVLLTALLLLSLAPALNAGPTAGPSGKMVFDGVADGLRKYRKEKDPAKRAALLKELAPKRDARVAVLLGDAMKNPDTSGIAAGILFWRYQLPPSAHKRAEPNYVEAAAWWHDHKADLRGRAAQLPRGFD